MWEVSENTTCRIISWISEVYFAGTDRQRNILFSQISTFSMRNETHWVKRFSHRLQGNTCKRCIYKAYPKYTNNSTNANIQIQQ